MDESKPLVVRVTADHIKRGLRFSPWQCPIALAIDDLCDTDEATGLKIQQVAVSCSYVDLFSPLLPGAKPFAYLPMDAKIFIGEFDNGFAVRPFTFTLPPLSEWKVCR